MKSCCKNCFYFTSREVKSHPLSEHRPIYGCKLHNLNSGEVNSPEEQRCESWISIISGSRNEKLEYLGIN